MDRLRSVNTNFWSDPWVENIKPEEKLLFLYLLTNANTNMLGVYEVSVKRMASETGLTEERVSKCFEVFERDGKGFYMKTYVILPNFLKNQKMNPNMKKNAVSSYNDLPNWLKESISGKPLEGFESLSKALECFEKGKGKGKGKNEIENEGEKEGESVKGGGSCLMKNSGITIQDVSDAFKKTKDITQADPEYYFNQVIDWSSNHGKMGKDWIAAIRSWARRDLAEGKLKILPYRPQTLT